MATSKPAIAALTALLVYAFAGYVLAPWLVRTQLPSLVETHLGAKGSVAAVRINPFLLTLEATDIAIAEKNGAPALQVGRLFADFEVSSLFRWAWTFREIRIERPLISADLDAKESLNLARLLDLAQSGTPAAPSSQAARPPRLLLQYLAISDGAFVFTDHTVEPAAKARLDPFNFEVHDVSTLPDQRGDLKLTARLAEGGSLQWQGRFQATPIDFSGAIAMKDAKVSTLWRFVRDRVAIAEPGGTYELGLRYRMRYGNGRLNLQGDDLSLRLKDLAIAKENGSTTLAKLASVALEGGTFDWQQRSVAFKTVRVTDGSVNLAVDRDGTADWSRLIVGSGARAKSTPAAQAPPPAATPSPWRASLPDVAIGPIAIAVSDARRVKPLRLNVGAAQASFGLAAAIGAEVQVTVENGALTLGNFGLGSGDDKVPLIAVESAEIAKAGFDLQKKAVRAGLLRLSGGQTQLAREADGSINLVTALAITRTGPAWYEAFTLDLDRAEVAGHSVAVTDRAFEPAVAFDIENLHAGGSQIALPSGKAIPVELALRVKQGGALRAKGTVDPRRPAADFRVNTSDVSLAPFAILLRQYTTLILASGKASLDGRVAWNARNAPDTLRYTGTARIVELDLKREDTGERLFSLQQLDATDMSLDTAANQLTIGRVGVVQPYAKLLINKDKSTNLGGVLRSRPEPATSGGTPTAIRVDRVSVERGAMDFGDQSLVLPFETHITALSGAVTGLSSDPSSRAALKFEGQIEEYGLARAEGTVQPFAPKSFTDIAVSFRNVAMTPLTPYSATFAGRKIESGRLSLDLQYKIADSQLAGDNKVALEKFTLGERVESPSAVSLPLDLAIALLTDSNGRIDLSVPVSGNVDNPQFSYGHLVWQAIRTVLTRIVTAPFRALGALFGGNTETLGDIVFDPGSARVLPTEQEKLARVAKGIQGRPQLKLVIQGRYDKEHDARALRTQAVRADLAAREGVKLAAGDDPGPATFHNAKTQRALETLLTERAGSDAVAPFAAEFRKRSGREAARVNVVLAMMDRGAGDRELYEAVFQRLVELRELPPAALTDLAKARAEAVSAALTQRLKLDPARLGIKVPEAADDGSSRGVPAKLSFEPVK